MTSPVIVWFRQDLRLGDNPAWTSACAAKVPVISVYILDDQNAGPWKMGGASRAWLHHSLTALNQSLGGKLVICKGPAEKELLHLAREVKARRIVWNRCYEPWRMDRDTTIKDLARAEDITCESFNGSLIWEPWDVKKQDGTPYRVFTPYFRKGCLSAEPPRKPLPIPKLPDILKPSKSLTIDDLGLLPVKPRWDTGMMSYWDVGEKAAQTRCKDFLGHKLAGYKEKRNYPALDHTSKLSPHLHFGEISPNQIWDALNEHPHSRKFALDSDCFMSELAWREFSHSLLYYNRTLPEEPLNPKFRNFEWDAVQDDYMERWQKGETGFPIIDAGMKELWATGYMHNRVRMIVASFLVKDLRYHWREGENWFWDTLVDADLANNAASWQWVAGCGADAAPYFRIFNPTTQGEKFDPDQAYIRQWAPNSYKIKPMLDHKKAREAALEAFKGMK